MKIISLICLCITFALFNSCKNDLDALAPYKESIAVYGLIDPTDSVNYIRVNRVFLGAGSAVDVAQIQDSVYFKPGEATVTVEKYWNGLLKQKYIFTETYEKPLQQGVFNANQLIYKSTKKFKPDSLGRFFEYVLKVTNNTTSTVFESEKIKLIKDISLNPSSSMCTATLGLNCFFNQSNVSILTPSNAKTKVMFYSPTNCASTSFKLRMHYRNLFLDNSEEKMYYEFDRGNLNAETSNGGELMDYTFSGVNFYSALSNGVPDRSNLKERVVDSMTFHFYFAGNEYKLYQEVNNTSGSFGQEKPIYTNMKNGAVGVFSSRTKIVVTKKMFDCSISPDFQNNVISNQTREAITSSSYTCKFRFRGPGCSTNTGC
jgi:hypothetical protein